MLLNLELHEIICFRERGHKTYITRRHEDTLKTFSRNSYIEFRISKLVHPSKAGGWKFLWCQYYILCLSKKIKQKKMLLDIRMYEYENVPISCILNESNFRNISENNKFRLKNSVKLSETAHFWTVFSKLSLFIEKTHFYSIF